MSAEHLKAIESTLHEMARLADGIDALLKTLKTQSAVYSEAVHHARKDNAPFEPFSQSTSHVLSNVLHGRLTHAAQNIGYQATQLLRFTAH